MMFLACHPVLARDARVALTLKTVCGFGVGEIARAFLSTRRGDRAAPGARQAPAARRRRRVRDRRRPSTPGGSNRSSTSCICCSTKGLRRHAGDQSHSRRAVRRGDPARAAARGRADARHARRPRAARADAPAGGAAARARRGGDELQRLADQNRSRWDRSLDRLAACGDLDRAASGDTLTMYHLEAGIAACHAVAPRYEDTDWSRIVELYDTARGAQADADRRAQPRDRAVAAARPARRAGRRRVDRRRSGARPLLPAAGDDGGAGVGESGRGARRRVLPRGARRASARGHEHNKSTRKVFLQEKRTSDCENGDEIDTKFPVDNMFDGIPE